MLIEGSKRDSSVAKTLTQGDNLEICNHPDINLRSLVTGVSMDRGSVKMDLWENRLLKFNQPQTLPSTKGARQRD